MVQQRNFETLKTNSLKIQYHNPVTKCNMLGKKPESLNILYLLIALNMDP